MANCRQWMCIEAAGRMGPGKCVDAWSRFFTVSWEKSLIWTVVAKVRAGQSYDKSIASS